MLRAVVGLSGWYHTLAVRRALELPVFSLGDSSCCTRYKAFSGHSAVATLLTASGIVAP